MSDDLPIGKGTTTLDYLMFNHPWLHDLIQAKDDEIENLKFQVKQSWLEGVDEGLSQARLATTDSLNKKREEVTELMKKLKESKK